MTELTGQLPLPGEGVLLQELSHRVNERRFATIPWAVPLRPVAIISVR
jgi:hypothetical protein